MKPIARDAIKRCELAKLSSQRQLLAYELSAATARGPVHVTEDRRSEGVLGRCRPVPLMPIQADSSARQEVRPKLRDGQLPSKAAAGLFNASPASK